MTAVWLGAPLSISNSEIQVWKDCRRKWYIDYYRQLGLPREIGAGPLALGTNIHLALELLYRKQIDPLATINEVYTDQLATVKKDDFAAVDKDSLIKALRSEHDLAKAMIEGYLEWTAEEGIDDGLEFVSAEEVVEVDSAISGVRLRGKLDQRWIRKIDGARMFRDWKSAIELTTPIKMLPLDQQMRMYGLLEHLKALSDEKDGTPRPRTDGGMYTMLRKVKRTARAKPPFFAQVEIQFNKETLRTHWTHVHKVLEEIVQARQALDAKSDHHWVTPPRPSRDCHWKCDHFSICPMFDNGENVEGLMKEYYTPIDPYDRYEKEELKGEI